MSTSLQFTRRLPIGVEPGDGGAHVRVWAPGHRSVSVVREDPGPATGAAEPPATAPASLEAEADGHWSAFVPGLGTGARYRLQVDGGDPVPDPASRFQPDGPHGPSQVVDPAAFRWTDEGWSGPDPARMAIYELHVGAYTEAGTYAAAAGHLSDLADLGIGVVELLPLGEFPGRFGWGYDGVDLFAPMHTYGTPDDLRAYIDRAHALGMGVILDVVYNHLGPDGCYLAAFSETYFSRRHGSDWGETPNFNDTGSDGVREFVLANARAWIEEYHLDGLRLDATQQVHDEGHDHILAAITREVRAAAAGRRTLVVAENEPQDTRLVRPAAAGGFGIDALWNDDIHHSAMVALTGRNEAYYTDYRGGPAEFVSAARHGFLFQGQPYSWQEDRRGTPALDLSPQQFVAYIQNHDQVANSARGDRISAIASPGRLRALTAYLLLGPARPMLFMGEEWAATSPFLFFADHDGPLADQVDAGRREFLIQFPSIAVPSVLAGVPVPSDPATFERSRLDHAERSREPHIRWLALHRDLLTIRRSLDGAPAGPPGVDGAVLNETAFCLRFFPRGARRGASDDERLLVVNLGAQTDLRPAPEPLLAPPLDSEWRQVLSTEDPAYGGAGAPPPETAEGWNLPAEAAVLLAPHRGASARRRPTPPPRRAPC